MIRIKLPLLAALVVFILVTSDSCAEQEALNAPRSIKTPHFTLKLVPGPEYSFTSWWFIFPTQIYPQVACWIETQQGDYIDTIYVTTKSAKKSWTMAPPDGRPEALPVWFHVLKNQNLETDAIAGATPPKDTVHNSDVAGRLRAGTYIAKLEINRSYDYNERYTRANSGVTGQPSLIYECSIMVGDKPSNGIFTPMGTGSGDGSDGNIRIGLDGITTATELIDSAEIFYGPGGAE